jgi:TatD DNase family protein
LAWWPVPDASDRSAVIDAHCHLASERFDPDRGQVIARARERLSAVVVAATDTESLRKSLVFRRQYPDFIYVTAGVHPRRAAQLGDAELEDLWQAVGEAREELVALGEVGPDFHHTSDPREQRRQLALLEQFMARAEAWSLPLVVHARKAEAAALEILGGHRGPVLIHCFTGDRDIARKMTARGFFLSFSPILLGSTALQEVARQVPVELVLTETDSPSLSPRPDQRRSEPAFVEMVVSRLAKLLEYRLDEMAAITAANARMFYRFTR